MTEHDRPRAAGESLFRLYCLMSDLFDDEYLYGWGDRTTLLNREFWKKIMAARNRPV